MPTLPPPTDADRDGSTTPSKPEAGLSQETQTADKENAPPAGTTTTTVAAAPNTLSPRTAPQQDAAATAGSSDATAPQLPPELSSLYTTITTALRTQFLTSPPHTVQRLSELVLTPRTHYRHLPPYLRALDRIISVSSTTAIFPLPQASIPTTSSTAAGGILNGVSPSPSASLGSDESLGGALLTPIPWLQQQNAATNRDRARSGSANGSNNNSELVSESTEMVDGPNGAGRIETVSVVNGVFGGTGAPTTTTTTTAAAAGGPATTTATAGASSGSVPAPSADQLREAGAITQGELLRQEQEAGVVPVGQTTNPRRNALLAVGDQKEEGGEDGGVELQEEVPHARGPEEVGVEDMGPQERGPGGGLNLEAAVGRAPVAAKAEKVEEAELSPEKEMRDVDDEGEAATKVEGKDKEGDNKEEGDVAEEAKKKRGKEEGGEGAGEEGGKKKKKRKKRTTAAARNKAAAEEAAAAAKSDTEMTD